MTSVSTDQLLATIAASGGGGGGPTAWDDIVDKPAVVAAGDTQAAARTAIGAGTGNSNLEIGTTASTAKAGNYQPTWAQVTGKPAVIAAGADAAAARTAIGAGTGNGTSNLTLAQAQAGIATKPAIAALTAESTLEDVIAALQA